MHVFPATAPIQVFPFREGPYTTSDFLRSVYRSQPSVVFPAHSSPRAEGGGVPLGEVPPNAPLVGAARSGRRAR